MPSGLSLLFLSCFGDAGAASQPCRADHAFELNTSELFVQKLKAPLHALLYALSKCLQGSSSQTWGQPHQIWQARQARL